MSFTREDIQHDAMLDSIAEQCGSCSDPISGWQDWEIDNDCGQFYHGGRCWEQHQTLKEESFGEEDEDEGTAA